jgi:hypothetical protein
MQTRVSHPYTTPLAAPPPPLNLLAGQGRGNQNLPAFAGARHTLGPTFSEEEDGDDSQFIAEKMAHLGLDRMLPRTGRPVSLLAFLRFGRGETDVSGKSTTVYTTFEWESTYKETTS